MGKVADGVKAGFVGGIPYGIVSGVFGYIALVTQKTQVINALGTYIKNLPISGTGITAQSLYNAELSAVFYGAIIGGIILGMIVGIIYAYVNKKLPGSKGMIKGLSFGLILWIILGVLLGLGSRSEFGNIYYLYSVIGSLIGSLVYGIVMGILFSHFEASNAPITEEPPYPQA